MPMFGNKHFSNPHVGRQHLQEPPAEKPESNPGELEKHSGAHAIEIHKHAGGFHTLTHHATGHEQKDHPDLQSVHDHLDEQFGGNPEQDQEPVREMMAEVKRSDDGAY